jgi:hypothetical protein
MRARIIKNSAEFGDFQEIWPVLDVFAVHRPALPAATENQLAKRKIVIVQIQLKKRAESQPSGARFVGRINMLLRALTSTNYN